jgi:hypothetical protein
LALEDVVARNFDTLGRFSLEVSGALRDPIRSRARNKQHSTTRSALMRGAIEYAGVPGLRFKK